VGFELLEVVLSRSSVVYGIKSRLTPCGFRLEVLASRRGFPPTHEVSMSAKKKKGPKVLPPKQLPMVFEPVSHGSTKIPSDDDLGVTLEEREEADDGADLPF